MKNVTAKSLAKQGGWSAPSIIFALLFATFLAKVGYVVGPAYYDNYLVQQALNDIAERYEDRLQRISKSEVSSELSKFYSLNGVRNLAITESLEVDRLKERTVIKVDYEVRANFFGNADVVLVFKNHLDSSRPDECCSPSE
jgi:hypothetical protein